MGTIIRNGGSGTAARIYRWNNLILRTPIVKRILPDQKKICQIGDPRSADSGGYLRAGFQGSNTYITTVQSVGYQLVNQWINGTPLWLDASGNHDPEFVWYQGAYATGAQTIWNGKYMSEAYASIPGFHFTFPTVSSPFQITGIKVYFLNQGCVWAYGQAYNNNNPNNKNIKNADYGGITSGVVMGFHVLNTPTCNYHPMDIAINSPYDEISIDGVGGTGDFKGWRDIFTNAPLGTVDGCIPTLTNPVRQSYNMGASALAHFTQNGAGWIVPTWLPSMTSTTDYVPRSGWGGTGADNYWACVSLRDLYIDVVYDVP